MYNCDKHDGLTVAWFESEHESCPVCKIQAENERLRDFVEGFADEPCEYGDNCPAFGSRHGQCDNCKAKQSLKGGK